MIDITLKLGDLRQICVSGSKSARLAVAACLTALRYCPCIAPNTRWLDHGGMQTYVGRRFTPKAQ